MQDVYKITGKGIIKGLGLETELSANRHLALYMFWEYQNKANEKKLNISIFLI